METPLVNIHTHHSESPPDIGIQSVLLCKEDQEFPTDRPFCTGIHPWDVSWLDTATIDSLLTRLETLPGTVAIGEIGLDYSRDIDHNMQEELLLRQLSIAVRRRLPVVLHCVRTFEHIMLILRKFALRGVIFHGFTGNTQQAHTALQAGYYLSLGDRSLRTPATMEALLHIPPERILLETDASEIPIAEVYARVAAHLGMSVEQLRGIIYHNYKRLF
jgi:TatD DNase family protein